MGGNRVETGNGDGEIAVARDDDRDFGGVVLRKGQPRENFLQRADVCDCAQIGPDEFVIVGQQIRVKFSGTGPNAGKNTGYARVEEGRFDANGKWVMERNWNGDQTDYGLNLPAVPTVLKVKMGSY